MKSILSLKHISNLIIVFIFVLMFAGATQAAPITLEIGKYRIGVISDPFSGAALWKNSQNEWECRFANASEMLSILAAVDSKKDLEAIAYAENLKQTRSLTPEEITYCNELIAISEKPKVWTVAKNSDRPDRPVYYYSIIDSVFTKGKLAKHREPIGKTCGKYLADSTRGRTWRKMYFQTHSYAVVCEIK